MKFVGMVLWRLDLVAKTWFAMRARLGANMYALLIGSIIFSLALLLGPTLLHAPIWLTYPLLLAGIILILLAHIGLFLCLDASMSKLPSTILRWMANGKHGSGVNENHNTDHTKRAFLFHWIVPRDVGLLEDNFLRYRFSAKTESYFERLRLTETPKADGKRITRRL